MAAEREDEETAYLPPCTVVVSKSTFWRVEVRKFKSHNTRTDLVTPSLAEMCHWWHWREAAKDARVADMSLVAEFLKWTRIQALLLHPWVYLDNPSFASDYALSLNNITKSSGERGWLLGKNEDGAHAQFKKLAELAHDRRVFAEEVIKNRRSAFNKILSNKFAGRDEFLIPHMRTAIQKFEDNPLTPASSKAGEDVYVNATRMAKFVRERWGGALDFLEWELRRTTFRVFGLLFDGDYKGSPGALKVIRESNEENKKGHIRSVGVRLIHAMGEMRAEPERYAEQGLLVRIVYKEVYLPHVERNHKAYPPLYTEADLEAEGAAAKEEEPEILEENQWQSIEPEVYYEERKPSSLTGPKDYFSSDEEEEDSNIFSSPLPSTSRKRPWLQRTNAQVASDDSAFLDVVDLTKDESQEEKKQRVQALIRQLLNA